MISAISVLTVAMSAFRTATSVFRPDISPFRPSTSTASDLISRLIVAAHQMATPIKAIAGQTRARSCSMSIRRISPGFKIKTPVCGQAGAVLTRRTYYLLSINSLVCFSLRQPEYFFTALRVPVGPSACREVRAVRVPFPVRPACHPRHRQRPDRRRSVRQTATCRQAAS